MTTWELSRAGDHLERLSEQCDSCITLNSMDGDMLWLESRSSIPQGFRLGRTFFAPSPSEPRPRLTGNGAVTGTVCRYLLYRDTTQRLAT